MGESDIREKWRNVPLWCPRCGLAVSCHSKDLMDNLSCTKCYNYIDRGNNHIKGNGCLSAHVDDEEKQCTCTIHEIRFLTIELQIANDTLIEMMRIKDAGK